MSKASGQFTSIGGQAVIEGVMMRSPHFITIAVRRANQRIVMRSLSYLSVSETFPFLKKPILRGVVTLLESMVQGVGALGFSAQFAAEVDQPDQPDQVLSQWAIAGSILTALFLAMGLFVALPHFLTAWITSSAAVPITAQNPLFHFMDGCLKMAILLIYVYLIAWMKDIHRVFQYHGAEHKSIYAFEAGLDLTVENARKFSTLHPRCGTSFLFFLMFMSIGVFSLVFPLFSLTELSLNPLLNHFYMVLIKIVLMLPVAGLAYEFIKACAFRMDHPFFRMLIWPGMVLQKLTTREPDDAQLEVALASLKQVLCLEKKAAEYPAFTLQKNELEIAQLSDLGQVIAQVAEFPEA